MFVRFKYLLAKDECMLFSGILLSVSFNCQSVISYALHKFFLLFMLISRYTITFSRCINRERKKIVTQMLSIRVTLVFLIRVGLEISGNRLQLNNKLMS